MTSQDLKVGDKVSWSIMQGKVTGSIKKKLTAPMVINTPHVAASLENLQLLLESASSGKVAAHKPAALKKVKAK